MEDGKSLAVTSRQGRDTWAYYRFDLETRRITDMLAQKAFDGLDFIGERVSVLERLTLKIRTLIIWRC